MELDKLDSSVTLIGSFLLEFKPCVIAVVNIDFEAFIFATHEVDILFMLYRTLYNASNIIATQELPVSTSGWQTRHCEMKRILRAGPS